MMISYDCKKLIFKIIKNVPKTVLNILYVPFFLIFMILDDIRLRILDYFDDDGIC